MSEDLTKKLPTNDSDMIALILTTVQNIKIRMDSLEKKVDERLYDTRPIWEKVVADIAQLQEGQRRLEGDVGDIKVSIRDIFFQMSAVGDTMRAIQGSHKDLDIRVRHLEQQQQKPTNSST
jgi:septal ring factor EnvC (AmiA/AmiB activator)